KSPAPALGVAGAGRFFERRLSMILYDQVPCRLSPFGLLAACLLALFALPSWLAAKPVASDLNGEPTSIAIASTVDPAPAASIVDDDADDDDEKAVKDDDDDADDDDADDDDDDDEPASRAKAKAEAKKAKAEAKKAKAEAKARAKAKESEVAKEIESKF